MNEHQENRFMNPLEQWWRNLTFWRRLLLECSICLGAAVLIGFIVDRAFKLEWIIEGLVLGIIGAIIDHKYIARR